MTLAAFSSLPGPAPWPQRLTTLAAFLVPALALTVPSGYSYGAVLLLLGALVCLPRWVRLRPDRGTLALVGVTFAMGLLWCVLSDPRESMGQWDRPIKFWLGALCGLFIASQPPLPRPRPVFWGLLAGCLGAGLVALWQVHAEGAPRASGFPSGRTNAIQWGNLALLLGAMLALQLAALWRQLPRLAVWCAAVAALLAVNASVLSQSRGGWLALLLALPLGLWLLRRVHPGRIAAIAAVLVAALAVLTAMNWQVVEERWERMHDEVAQYDTRGEADNSVGQRLEHWRFAWQVGMERPLTGWGMAGYMREKAARVAAGQYERSIMEYIYVHNELLDIFVKTGLGGVLLMLCFYGVPAALFWPGRRRMQALAGAPEAVRAQVLALRLSGLAIPVLYAGFGITQVFFAHNSGIMFYIFMNMVVWAALLGVQPSPATRAADARA